MKIAAAPVGGGWKYLPSAYFLWYAVAGWQPFLIYLKLTGANILSS